MKAMWLKNGGKLELFDDGLRVISSSGEVCTFDSAGNLVSIPDEETSCLKENFFKMGAFERALVENWYQKQKTFGTNDRVHQFMRVVGQALEIVDYDYYISTIEASSDENGSIVFEKGGKILTGLSCDLWAKKAEEFAPEYNSRLANVCELFMWYAYRAAKGYWDLKYLCFDSSTEGNYCDSPGATNSLEPAGARVVGGFADGSGNTTKLVFGPPRSQKPEDKFWLCGGPYVKDGGSFPVADGGEYTLWYRSISHGTGVIVLVP